MRPMKLGFKFVMRASRVSTSYGSDSKKDVDGRDKPGHDN